MMFEDSDAYAAVIGDHDCRDSIPASPCYSSSSSPAAAEVEDNNGGNFKETFKNLDALARLLICLKCGNLPNEKIWTLGCCLHKYCETCVKILSGKSCIVCYKSAYPKDAKPDLFSSAILAEIPSVYMTIARLEDMTWDQKEADPVGIGNDENEKMQEEGDKGVGVEMEQDPFEFTEEKEIQCTPVNHRESSVSQNFPEVLEETPQNKVRGRYSVTNSGSGNKTFNPVSLKFSSYESVENETEKKETSSPEKESEINSDDELFRSPRPRRKSSEVAKKSPEDGLPVLTPYKNAKLSPKNKNRKNRKKSGGTNSGDPPALTPQKRDSNKEASSSENNLPIKRAVLRRRKSSVSSANSESSIKSTPGTGNRRGRKSVKSLVVDDRTANPTEKSSEPKIILHINKRKSAESLPSTKQKRNVSSGGGSSELSASVSTPTSSKEKRNAKGETTLHVACRAGRLDKVQSLVDEEGADVNAKDHADWTPIHEVINGKGSHSAKANILRFLCEKKGDVNALGGSDETPLHSAVQSGVETLVEILLEFNASPNIRNKAGKLPKDVAFNEVIIKLLDEKMGNAPRSSCSPENINLDSSSFLGGTASMVDEDPAVMQVMLKKAVVYFNYKVDRDVVQATKQKLALKVSDELTASVTHVIHQLPNNNDLFALVPLSMEYLYALAHCMWQVSSLWITRSLENGVCLIPTSYEIVSNNCQSSGGETQVEVAGMVPSVSRMNREKGNPGLLDGFCFYLYKTCGYNSPELKLSKKQLIELIHGAGGSTIIREPNPDNVDPTVETAQRFHVSNSRKSSEVPVHINKFTLTSHIILYEEGAPPPPNKRYNMEHVKSLKSSWVIDSLLNFRLEDPDKYL